MGKEDIIAYQFNSETGREHGSRPVSAKGRRNIGIGRRLYELKKKGFTDAKVKELFDIMTSEDASHLEYLQVIEKMKYIADPTNIKDQEIIAKAMKEWHASRHGTKHHIKSENVNININVAQEEFDKRMKKLNDDPYQPMED